MAPLPRPPVAWIDLTTGQPTQAFLQYISQLDSAVGGTGGAGGFGGLATTGDLKPTHKTTADAGWILWSDGTIGDASSGSSIRANTDTSSLFTLYYNGYSDANCPLLTSGGAATTRGAQGTAAQAFAAHCRMTLPKGAGRALALAGAGAGLTSRTPGDAVGAETETPTIAKTAAHTHNFADCTSGGGPQNLQGGTSPVGPQVATSTTGSGTALNIMQPTAFVNVMIKL